MLKINPGFTQITKNNAIDLANKIKSNATLKVAFAREGSNGLVPLMGRIFATDDKESKQIYANYVDKFANLPENAGKHFVEIV